MRRLWLFAILIYSTHSLADETLAELSLEELTKVRVTSIATGNPKSTREAPAIASIITARDIQAMGATTFEEALIAIPGLHVSTAGVAYTSNYLIRGGFASFYNPEVLLMMNGIPIDTLFRLIGVVPVKLISKIEVIRGPGSALYGADAFSGVINVITKSASDIRGTEMGGHIGSFATREAWLFHSEDDGELKASIIADYRSTDGHKEIITEDGQTALDRTFGTSASLAPGPVQLSEKAFALYADVEKSKWRLRGSYYGTWDRGLGQGVSALDPNGRLSHSRTMIDLIHHEPRIGEHWKPTSLLSFRHESHVYEKYFMLSPPGANLGNGVFPNGVLGRTDYFERHIRLDEAASYSGIENHLFRIGLGYRFTDLYQVGESNNYTLTLAPRPVITDVTDTPDSAIPELSKNSFYGYLQDEWKLSDDWDFTAGGRYDYYSDFGGTLNPRAALVWKTTPDLTTKFLYGRAFRAPNYTELYLRNNPVATGNPNLSPETINTYEIGWVYQPNSDWYSALNFFYYEANDVITDVRDPLGTATIQNFGTQSGQGLEFETKLQAAKDLLLTGSLSFAKSTDKNSAKPVGDYPLHRVYFRDDWRFYPNWMWGNQLNWVGKRARNPSDTRATLKGYGTLDLILRHSTPFDKFTFTASIRNLLDADVREPSRGPGATATAAAIPNDLPQAPRSMYVELAYRL